MEKLPVHEFKWTDATVKRFWDTMYQYPNAIGFAGAYGEIMIKKINKAINLENKEILDFGVGHGYLTDALLKITKKAKIAGYDTSTEGIAFTANRFKKEPRFIGAFTPENRDLYKEKFDIVLMTEVLEHILDENLKTTFESLKYFLKKGGHLVITIPNNEDVESKKIFCPDCGSLFHPVQHIKGYSTNNLIAELSKYNFEAKYVNTVNFKKTNSIKGILREIYTTYNKAKRSNILGVFEKK